jgi:hypothetical protein
MKRLVWTGWVLTRRSSRFGGEPRNLAPGLIGMYYHRSLDHAPPTILSPTAPPDIVKRLADWLEPLAET